MRHATIRDIANEAKMENRNNHENNTMLIDIQTVIDIIESEKEIENPIQKLINKAYYESLIDTAKQEYILDVAKNFLKLKKIYLDTKKLNR